MSFTLTPITAKTTAAKKISKTGLKFDGFPPLLNESKMKNLIILFAFLLSGISVHAQKYFTYDCESFSVLMTCDTGNTTITGVEYSQNNEWVPFTIISRKNQERKPGSGFLFRVVDKNGNKFLLDYLRSSDVLFVTNTRTGIRWKLDRRNE